MSHVVVLLSKRGCFSSTGAAKVEGLFMLRPPYMRETRNEEDRKEADERAEAFQEALVCDVGSAGDDDNDDDGKF